MEHIRKALSIAVPAFLVAAILLPALMPSADAAPILESEREAAVVKGDMFVIRARGYAADADSGVRIRTTMRIGFVVERAAERRALFRVTSGYCIINGTRYEIAMGVGRAGRPVAGRFNGTAVFGFVFNATGADQQTVLIRFRGVVVREPGRRPFLVMGGRLALGSSTYNLRQRGFIGRYQS